MLNIDMDGVVADFDRGIVFKYGCPMEELPSEEADQFWNHDCVNDSFFANLRPIDEGVSMVSRLAKEEIPFTFLTSTGGGANHWGIAQQKIQWLGRVFSPDLFPVAFCLSTAGKARFASGPKSFLIDDRQKVINAWQEAGGTAKLFTPNDSDSIADYAISHYDHYLRPLK